jgi:hypothetical protein
MSIPKKSDTPSINQEIFNMVSALIVSLMMTCISITIVLFGSRLIPGWNVVYLPVFCFLVALERIRTFKITKKLLIFSRRWIVYHLTQWVVLLIVLKIVMLIANPPESLWVEIQLWRLDLFSYFFDTGYILAILFVFLIWMITGYFAYLLDEMSLEEAMARLETRVKAAIAGPPARERLLGIIFALGFVLVILTAIMRVNLRVLFAGDFENLNVQSLPYLAAGAWNVLLYFILGLLLMSQSQLARLNARWMFQKIEVTPRLAARWATYSVIFILFLALVASVLPTNYSLGFLSVLGYILRMVIGVLFFIIGFLWSLIILIFNLLLSIMGISPQSEFSLPTSNFTPPTPPAPSPTTSYPWLEVLKSLLFWIVFLGVIVFSATQFIRQHEDIMDAVRKVPGLSWIMKFFQWLFGGMRKFRLKISQSVEIRLQKLRDRQRNGLTDQVIHYLNLRRLNPQQRVYFFFLAMIRRGGEKGFPRKDSDTPYEYANKLEADFPEIDEDIDSLTNIFVEARYTRVEIDDEKAGMVRRYWERIRRALRSFKG